MEGTGSLFSPFYVNDFLIPILQVYTIFNYARTNNKEKKWGTITIISLNDTMSAEKPLPWNLLVFTTSKETSAP